MYILIAISTVIIKIKRHSAIRIGSSSKIINSVITNLNEICEY